jgi:sterol desaturase/sphingolipid hydroxylase (fatty acid hydroxylase superfamily)
MLIPEISLAGLHIGPISLPIIPLILVAVLLLLLALETASPLRRRTRPRIQCLTVNFSLTAAVIVAAFFVVRSMALATPFWAANRNFGFLRLVGLPAPAAVSLGVVLMDLTFYRWHRTNHWVFLLWRFHGVHHLDPGLDVTTATRFHFGEVLYTTGFRVLQVDLLGVNPFTILLYGAAVRSGLPGS